MNEAVIKEEVIEEEFNLSSKNGEFVEVKQEEIEQKPENFLEKEVKKEPVDFFENNNSDGFREDVELKPTENACTNKQIFKEVAFQCKICQMRMPRKLLKLIKSEDDKTVLSEIFKIEGFDEINPTYVCYSHIKTIIDDNDDKMKSPSTDYERLLRSFIKRNKNSMRNRTSQRRYCLICHRIKDCSQLYRISSKNIRMVIMIGCILRGTHSIEQAVSYITNDIGFTCYSHRKDFIVEIFEHLRVQSIREFFRCPRISMSDFVDIAKNFDPNFTVDQFILAFNTLFLKNQKFESNL
ncbi:hypothetical protein B9Z55_021055 [Caenorhabditis nigoni]|uniref:Lin-15A/B-like domain-containing protein n=1 Tax=Caenorhabditis nigoni TaxID=1611254 RepID=A0A2G5TQC3_9PELO|nr:hypothetical protein B9Z55_021055 [Caenorhabditis nigoni]